MNDFILNGVAHGSVANRLLATNGDVGVLRPWIGKDGRTYISLLQADGTQKSVRVDNATATLRKDEWIKLDTAIIKAAKPRLKLVSDLRSAGLVLSIPNGMSKSILQHQTQSDVGPATVSMDGLRKGERDRPVYDLTNLPLPIIHADFNFSLREILISRNGGNPLDTSTAELKARRVAETAEKMLSGTYGTYAYGGGTIYGLTNFPGRITHTITAPTTTGWTPRTATTEVMAMIQKARNKFYYGPYRLYVTAAWAPYLDDDYRQTAGDATLRQRLMQIEGIQDIMTADYLEAAEGTGATFAMVLVQMTSDVIREVVGMDITTLQWETEGGMEINYKIMAIMVPQLRTDQNGSTGIVHGA